MAFPTPQFPYRGPRYNLLGRWICISDQFHISVVIVYASLVRIIFGTRPTIMHQFWRFAEMLDSEFITIPHMGLAVLAPKPTLAVLHKDSCIERVCTCNLMQFRFADGNGVRKGRVERGMKHDGGGGAVSAVVERVPLISRLQDRELQEMRDEGR